MAHHERGLDTPALVNHPSPVRCCVTLLVLLVIPCLALANPIVTDEGQRPSEMLWEKVTVHVGRMVSKVEGTYRFRLKNEAHPDRPYTHVTVWLPIILPETGETVFRADEIAYEKKYGSPDVSLGGRKFAISSWHDISRSDQPEFNVSVPKNWYIASYYCDVPIKWLKPEYELQISYSQPHFAGDIVGYIPFRPPGNGGTSRIYFEAATGSQVRKDSWLAPFFRAHDFLEFRPVNRQMIRVQSILARKSKSAS
jgi:hypothetical protein